MAPARLAHVSPLVLVPLQASKFSQCGRTGRQRLPGTCSARRATTAAARLHGTRLGPRPRLIWSIKAFPPYRQSGRGSHASSRPSLLPLDLGGRDTDTVLAGSPSFPPFHAPYSDRTFRPASSRRPGILTRISPDSTRVGRMLTDAGAAPHHRPHNPSSPPWAVSALELRPTITCNASLSRRLSWS